MATRQFRCPGCGADVHPDAAECPECGRALGRSRPLLPLLVGVMGVVVALAAGVAVWVLLDPGPRPPSAPQASVQPPAVAPPSAPADPPAAQASVPPAPEPSPAPDANAAEAPLPLPHPSPDVAPVADEATRREFARATEENFVKNGLDMKVGVSGPRAETITLAFTFPARMAVELIVGGPFPRQCKQRGFTQIAFTDPNGGAWSYDIAESKLTVK